VVGTLSLLSMTDLSLNQVLFETTSAFGTVGLSTGITAQLPAAAQYVLVVLMFIGRTGPITLASALALRQRRTPRSTRGTCSVAGKTELVEKFAAETKA
jgi:Trk-type K+ transport system membrane component